MSRKANGVAGPAKNRHDAADEQGHLSTPRRMRARTPIAVVAQFVSQLTCMVLLGIDPRRFLDVLVPRCRPDVVHVGKLRLVELSRAVEALRSMASADDAETETPVRDDDDPQPETADAVLSAIGKELAS